VVSTSRKSSWSAAQVTAALAAALGRHAALLHAAGPPVAAEVAVGSYAYPRQLDVERIREAGERLLARLVVESGLSSETEQRVELGDTAAVRC
jgi:hypothetical protein